MNNDQSYSSSTTDDRGPICLSNRRRKMGFIGGSFESVNHFRCTATNSTDSKDQNEMFKNFDKSQIKSFSIDCGELTQAATKPIAEDFRKHNGTGEIYRRAGNNLNEKEPISRENFTRNNGIVDSCPIRSTEEDDVSQNEPIREDVIENHRTNDIFPIRSIENEYKKEPIREYFLRNNGIIDICPIRGVEDLNINNNEPVREDFSRNNENNSNYPIRNVENQKEPITEDYGHNGRIIHLEVNSQSNGINENCAMNWDDDKTKNHTGSNEDTTSSQVNPSTPDYEILSNKMDTLLMKNMKIPKYFKNESIDIDEESDKENCRNIDRKNVDEMHFQLEDDVTIKKMLQNDDNNNNSSLNDDYYGKNDKKVVNDKEKRVRRTSSLKSPKESSNAEKKIVRFADALGLDLTDVRTFLDEIPSIPKSAYNDLEQHEDETLVPVPIPFCTLYDCSSITSSKSLIPLFQQPKENYDFLDKVRDNYVCLEEAKCTESAVVSVSGIVRVRNLDFCKSVYVRYTTDKWKHYFEVQANYVENSCDGFSDKFEFSFYLYNININQFIEFSIRYHCIGCQFWDNNNGQNYIFQCLPCENSNSHYLTTPHTTSNALCSSFY